MLNQPARTSCLQDVGSETEDGCKTGTGGGESLVSGASEGGNWSGVGASAGDRRRSVRWGGGIDVWCWGAVWNSRANRGHGAIRDRGASARGVHGSGHWLGDRAWAVGDRQSGSLGDGVGNTTVGDLGGRGAVGGVSSHNLSGVSWAGIVAPGIGASDEGSGSSNGSGETHVDGINDLRW
jgi:hypothetical protein